MKWNGEEKKKKRKKRKQMKSKRKEKTMHISGKKKERQTYTEENIKSKIGEIQTAEWRMKRRKTTSNRKKIKKRNKVIQRKIMIIPLKIRFKLHVNFNREYENTKAKEHIER